MKKNPRVGLPEVSKLIDSEISNRQGDRRKHSFLEKEKILHKRESALTMSNQNITSLDGLGYKAIHLSISQNNFFFKIPRNVTVEDNKKIMNITNFVNIYVQIYISILHVTKVTRNKNDSINSRY